MRLAPLVGWSVLSFTGTLALLLYDPDTAFYLSPAILFAVLVVPFVRIDLTPWAVVPSLGAFTLWTGSAPGFYAWALAGATFLAVLYGVVMLLRFSLLARRRPVTSAVRRTWVTTLVAGIVVGFVTASATPLELRFRLSEAAMRQVARDVIHGRRDPEQIDRVGLWNVEEMERIEGGVRFYVEGAGLLERVGFVYVTNGLPPPDARYYGSGWFTFSSNQS